MSMEDEVRKLGLYQTSDEDEDESPFIGEGSILIEGFNPHDKEFYFNFPGDTCYKKVNGICSLDEFKNDLMREDYDHSCNRSQYPNCVNIYFGLRNKSIKRFLPYVFLHICGHYSCGDGQHRVCVAQKMGLLLDVEYCDEILEAECDKCKKEKR